MRTLANDYHVLVDVKKAKVPAFLTFKIYQYVPKDVLSGTLAVDDCWQQLQNRRSANQHRSREKKKKTSNSSQREANEPFPFPPQRPNGSSLLFPGRACALLESRDLTRFFLPLPFVYLCSSVYRPAAGDWTAYVRLSFLQTNLGRTPVGRGLLCLPGL